MDPNPIIELGGGVQALAKKIGVSHSAVSHWKARGKFPPGQLIAVSRHLGISVEELVSLSTSPTPLAPLTPPREQRDGAERAVVLLAWWGERRERGR